ncbi:hypothetical protein Tco_1110799 [Tanacetum coccineum]|uniref:Uncharacterized protein n=1 Tax=Tanacetum coccineum TaxID=301880 RepID=A0ABQ5IJT4_9ASTR
MAVSRHAVADILVLDCGGCERLWFDRCYHRFLFRRKSLEVCGRIIGQCRELIMCFCPLAGGVNAYERGLVDDSGSRYDTSRGRCAGVRVLHERTVVLREWWGMRSSLTVCSIWGLSGMMQVWRVSVVGGRYSVSYRVLGLLKGEPELISEISLEWNMTFERSSGFWSGKWGCDIGEEGEKMTVAIRGWRDCNRISKVGAMRRGDLGCGLCIVCAMYGSDESTRLRERVDTARAHEIGRSLDGLTTQIMSRVRPRHWDERMNLQSLYHMLSYEESCKTTAGSLQGSDWLGGCFGLSKLGPMAISDPCEWGLWSGGALHLAGGSHDDCGRGSRETNGSASDTGDVMRVFLHAWEDDQHEQRVSVRCAWGKCDRGASSRSKQYAGKDWSIYRVRPGFFGSCGIVWARGGGVSYDIRETVGQFDYERLVILEDTASLRRTAMLLEALGGYLGESDSNELRGGAILDRVIGGLKETRYDHPGRPVETSNYSEERMGWVGMIEDQRGALATPGEAYNFMSRGPRFSVSGHWGERMGYVSALWMGLGGGTALWGGGESGGGVLLLECGTRILYGLHGERRVFVRRICDEQDISRREGERGVGCRRVEIVGVCGASTSVGGLGRSRQRRVSQLWTRVLGGVYLGERCSEIRMTVEAEAQDVDRVNGGCAGGWSFGARGVRLYWQCCTAEGFDSMFEGEDMGERQIGNHCKSAVVYEAMQHSGGGAIMMSWRATGGPSKRRVVTGVRGAGAIGVTASRHRWGRECEYWFRDVDFFENVWGGGTWGLEGTPRGHLWVGRAKSLMCGRAHSGVDSNTLGRSGSVKKEADFSQEMGPFRDAVSAGNMYCATVFTSTHDTSIVFIIGLSSSLCALRISEPAYGYMRDYYWYCLRDTRHSSHVAI